MRKVTAFLCLLLMVMAGGALATQTRVLTVGENGGVMMDEENIFTWPQTLVKYSDLGIVDIMDAGIVRGGGHSTMGNFALGGYYTDTPWSDPYLPDYFGAGLNEKISLIYAREIGGMPFGFSFSLFGNGHEKKGTDKTLHSGLGLNIGFGLTLMENLETALTFSSLSWEEKDNTGAKVSENEGGTTIAFDARYWLMQDEKFTFIPHLSFEIKSTGIKPAVGNSIKDDATTIDLGFGTNTHIGKVLLVDDIGIRFMSQTVDSTVSKIESTDNFLPYFRSGVEAPISEKFTFRFGGVREWTSKSEKVGSDEESRSGATTTFYIGLGYNRGPFTVDFWMDPGFFTRGPYLISGSQGNLALQASLKYIWGEGE